VSLSGLSGEDLPSMCMRTMYSVVGPDRIKKVIPFSPGTRIHSFSALKC
jgi:hypothetical protein